MSITKVCRISWKEFIITDEEIVLLDKISPVIGGEKFSLPLPTLCPEERQRRRLSFKNFFSLHKWVSSLSGQPIISIYPPEYPGPVYSQYEWWSDARDPYAYSLTLDTERAIWESWYELLTTAPQVCLENSYELCENSEYINGNGISKDCYLVSNGADNEKCLYSYYLFGASNILNVTYCRFSENCSFSNHLYRCYDVHFSFDIPECRNSWYIFSCKWSHHLIGCVGLENQNYQILNQPASPEQYETTLAKLKTDKNFRDRFIEKLERLIEQVGVERYILTGSMDSTGDFCYDSSKCHECYCASDSQDSAHIHDSYDTYDSMDIDGWGDHTSLSYDCVAVGQHIDHIYWSSGIMNSSYIFYSWQCDRSSYLFGCFGLKDAQYCIYNRQYTQEQWERHMKVIFQKMQSREEWGEFVDAKYSPYAYNESHAGLILPLSNWETVERWLWWANREEKLSNINKTIPASKLPYDIIQIPDDVLNWAILCERTGKPYKIQPLELDLHRRFWIPLPRLHPLERIQKLLDWNNRTFDFDF